MEGVTTLMILKDCEKSRSLSLRKFLSPFFLHTTSILSLQVEAEIDKVGDYRSRTRTTLYMKNNYFSLLPHILSPYPPPQHVLLNAFCLLVSKILVGENYKSVCCGKSSFLVKQFHFLRLIA